MRDALRHPFGLTLLITSLLLAGVMRFLPALESWSAQALWVLLLGLLAYATSLLTLHRTRPHPFAPELGNKNTRPTSTDVGSDGQSLEDFPRLVEEALRRLTNPAALSTCRLIQQLPETLAAAGSQQGAERVGQGTPLAQAQALREVLVAAIERLKAPGEGPGTGTTQDRQYHILRERYLQHRPIAYSMTRHSISESTFHRDRKDAISALAHHLATQEELIVRGQPLR